MTTLAFDGRMGASGDMLLGALIACGADPAVLEPVEDGLGVAYRQTTTEQAGIAATDVTVLLDDSADEWAGSWQSAARRKEQETSGDHPEEDSHSHSEESDAANGHDHGEQSHAEGGGGHRSYQAVVDIIADLEISSSVKDDARSIVRLLGEAEAAVHNTDLEEMHFHEVGADDAIADIVGACLLLDDLDVQRVITTPIASGSGDVEMSHGTYPVPAPAVVELAGVADWSLTGGPVEGELLTPTGAAILSYFASGVDALPSMDVTRSGYGAGSMAFPERPNVLRGVIGTVSGALTRDEITVLETNVDDVSPEVLGDLQRSLQSAGARDVSIVPLTMKKGRPGHLVKVVCKPEDAQQVAHRLATETGTLGIREHGAGHRWIASRDFETVAITVDEDPYEVAVKIASDETGDVFDVSAEYADAVAVAEQTDLAVRDVIRRAEDIVRSLKES
jgi:uncharacterized protein (TIGR00299 family) protein